MQASFTECKPAVLRAQYGDTEVTVLTRKCASSELHRISDEFPGTLPCIEENIHSGIPDEFVEKYEFFLLERYAHNADNIRSGSNLMPRSRNHRILHGLIGRMLRNQFEIADMFKIPKVKVRMGPKFFNIEFPVKPKDAISALDELQGKSEGNSESVQKIEVKRFGFGNTKKNVKFVKKMPWYQIVRAKLGLGEPATLDDQHGRRG